MRITPSNTENAMQRIKPWPKLSQWPIRGKENTFKNQWQLKQKPSKLRKARENAGDQVVIGVSFAFNWLRLWRDVFWATLRYSIENCSKVNKTYCAIHQIQIFPINSVIPPSNNRSQVCRCDFAVGCIPNLFPAYYLANFFSIVAIFNWALIISQDCFGFALLRCVIGSENSHHLLNQSDATWLPAFSRAFGSSFVFTRNFHWLSWWCLSLRWLAVVTTFTLALRHSIENCSNTYSKLPFSVSPPPEKEMWNTFFLIVHCVGWYLTYTNKKSFLQLKFS